MKRILLIGLLSNFAYGNLYVSKLPASSVPIVAKDQFTVGSTWEWHYYKSGNKSKPYSYERYTILKNRNGIIN